MTCPDAREQLSALLDDALTAAERAALETHLATCADCRREMERLRSTVTLLGRLGPAHAPPGFVDRVMIEAYRPAWPRRLLDTLFRPLRVKLPLEAAAVLLVGISALYVYERTPEVRQLARPGAPAPPAPAPPPMAGPNGEAPARPGGAAGGKIAPAEQERARESAPSGPPLASAPASGGNAGETGGAGTVPAPMTDLRSAATPVPQSEAKPDAKKETQAEPRPDAAGVPGAVPAQKLAKSAAPAPSRDALAPRLEAESSTSAAAPPAGSAAAPGARGGVGGAETGVPATPAHEPASGEAAAQKSRTAVARLMRVADASGRLVVPAAEPAEIALDALLSRLGATRVARRVEHPPGPILVDVNIPVARYRDLLEGLGHIGRWTLEHEAKALPPLAIRLQVAIFVEP